MSEAQTIREIEVLNRNKHRIKSHIYFLETCLQKNILPKFTIISPITVRKFKLQSFQIYKFRQNLIIDALNKHNNNLITTSQKYNFLSTKLNNTNPDSHKLLSILSSRIKKIRN